MYFPLIVHEALMVEPTKTESRETLNEAIRAFREIYDYAKKDALRLYEAPVHAYIRRPDEVQAARKPVLRYSYCYHHGTLLVDVDQKQMSRYLNVPQEKLRSNGVESVRARTVNLKSLQPDLTIRGLRQALMDSFAEVYGCEAEQFPEIIWKRMRGKRPWRTEF